MEADVLHGMVFLPPTSDCLPDPEPLEREELNSTYLELRNYYSSLMRSRAQNRRLANKAKDETALLKERIKPSPAVICRHARSSMNSWRS
jgi:hypothetical protein